MVFQILLLDSIRNTFYYLQTGGIIDIIIPFILIFTVLFTVLKKVPILSEAKHHIAIALAITFLVIIPHITGTIDPRYDVINIINNSMPTVVLIIFIFLTALILLGLIKGGEAVEFGEIAKGIMGIAAIVLVAIIFARSAGYLQYSTWPTWLYWLDDPQLGALVIVILMFAAITWFITYEKTQGKGAIAWLKKYLPAISKELFGGKPGQTS